MNVNYSTEDNETRAPIIPLHTLITSWSILLVWSLLANVLVIAVVYCNQNMRTNMNYLIVHMAVSDLLVPLVALPSNISLSMTNGEWLVDGPLGEALCKLVHYFSELSPFVSSMSLVIIAFQRFMAIVYPNRKNILSSRQARWIAMCFPWIVAMALLSPYFYTHRLKEERGYTMCYFSWSSGSNQSTANAIYRSIAAVVGFVVPLIVTITMYSIIVHELRQCLNNVRGMMKKETIRLRQRRNRRIFSMLITIVVLFTICWCPLFFLFMLEDVVPSFSSKSRYTLYTINVVFSYMWYLLAAINPCIYFVFLKDFRQGLKSLCCRKTASTKEQIPRGPRTPDGDCNQDPTCTPAHINTTSV